MRRSSRMAWGCAIAAVLFCVPALGDDASPVNPFYVLDNGVRGEAYPTPEAQARLVKELGFAGMSHSGTDGVGARLDALDRHGLKLYTVYVPAYLDGDKPKYDPKLLDVIRQLNGRETMVWLTIQSGSHKPSSPDGDARAVEIVRELADAAADSGVRIALYPHTWFWMERVEDAVRVAKQVDRPNVGVTFNLCHWLRTDSPDTLDERLELARPYLFQVTINGADTEGDWDRLIQPLDRGSYDVSRVLRGLRRIDYTGPIGLQCYNIKQPPREHLSRSMAAWKRLSRYLTDVSPAAIRVSEADIVVSPDGSDDAAGTRTSPFRTIARAQRAVRDRGREELRGDVVVMIRGGTYVLDEPLVFGPADSGTASHAVVYAAWPGEEVIISGGRPVSGFVKTGDNEWTAELDDVKAGEWFFRQLFKDGERQTRARFPNAPDVLRITETSKDVRRITFDRAVSGGDLAGQDAEVVVLQNWCVTRAKVASSAGTSVTATIPVGWIGHGAEHNVYWTTASPGKAAWLEHSPAFADQPGEWYLDRASGRLTYISDDGEDPNDHAFTASRLEQVLTVRGDRETPVRNLHFRGLTFAHTEWPLPEIGYVGTQAGHHGTDTKGRIYVLPAAVEMTYAEDCQLERCRVLHTGASGIGLGAGCRRNRIDHCEVADISGNGVMFGLRGDREFTSKPNRGLISEWTDAADVPVGNAIRNSHVHDCGAVYFGCVGIYDAYCRDSLIAHNLVNRLPYTGISVGFKWDSEPSSQQGCRVAYNHVHDVMRMLADGGAIYTLGYQPGTVLRGNLLHDVHRSRYAHGGAPNNGIFFDQGSKGYRVEGNIIYHTSGDPIRFNQCRREDQTWADNHFGVAPGEAGFPKEAAAEAGPMDRGR